MTLTETNQSITVCMRVCVCGRWVWISLTHYCPQPSKRAVLSLIIKVYLLHPPSFFSFLSTLFSLLTIPKHSSPTLIPYYLWTPSFFISTLPFYLLPLIHLIINFLSLISPSFIFLCSTHFSLCLSIHHHMTQQPLIESSSQKFSFSHPSIYPLTHSPIPHIILSLTGSVQQWWISSLCTWKHCTSQTLKWSMKLPSNHGTLALQVNGSPMHIEIVGSSCVCPLYQYWVDAWQTDWLLNTSQSQTISLTVTAKKRFSYSTFHFSLFTIFASLLLT